MKVNIKVGVFQLSASLLCIAGSVPAQNSFTTLQAGFTQTLFGHAPAVFAGVAFAQNEDVLVVHTCSTYPPGNPISRFVLGATTPDGHGGMEHPEALGSPFPSGAQCGVTNHPNGFLYANTFAGITKLDPSTFAQLSPPVPPEGTGLGIAVDPQTNNVVYVGRDCNATLTCSILSADPVSLISTNFAHFNLPDRLFFDGIAFDPSGKFLFLSVRPNVFLLNPPCNGECFVVVFDRTGTFVQAVPLTAAPDGISFHVNPSFVVTNNNDGTLTRLDFPSGNFTLPPSLSVLASGGFRGDLSQVGPDGCLYVTQGGTRFSDTTTSDDNSVVQLCPNFVPPPGVNPAPGRMTGGGRVFSGGTQVTHGFELHCNIKNTPNTLEINWGHGNSFHLETLSASVCFADPSVNGDPAAGFNTVIGLASGSYNGTKGATARFTFTDAGEPGKGDFANLLIEAEGATVLSVSGNLESGNQQAHPE
jgi:hypothetical protein